MVGFVAAQDEQRLSRPSTIVGEPRIVRSSVFFNGRCCFDIVAKGREKQSEMDASRAAVQAKHDQMQAADEAQHVLMEQLEQSFRSLLSLRSESDKRLIKESTKQPTNTDEPAATPAYRFIVRDSLFPEPKRCNFFHRHGRKYSIRPKQKSH